MSDEEVVDEEAIEAESSGKSTATGESTATEGASGTGDEAQSEAEPDPDLVRINLNGREVAAEKGEMVIAAADRAGEYIPHFCYHPRMSPVGMCRQCMVEVEGPRGPMMVVSCMTPVSDGQVVRTDTPEVKKAQEGILELLLANHPLDCPVCDKGGECPLQDQAFSHGPGESRFVEEKRHYEKPIPISDLVLLDRERCILCDRCTRFADEVAGDKLIHFTQRGNNTQVMTYPDEPFASYFSGNVVQICPVGALTAEPYRFKARPWDLDQGESTCTTCSVGCRTIVQSSRDELLRYQGADSDPVNWGWLCDRGRFNFEAVNSDQRLENPHVKTDGGLTRTTWNTALHTAASLVEQALHEGGPDSVALLGGARGTNEDAFVWAQLADAIGVTRRDAQLGDGLPVEVLGQPRATIDEAANAATVILLGPDLKEELPVLHLRLRDAAEKKRSRLLEFSPLESGLTRSAWRSVRHSPGQQADAVRTTLHEDDVATQLGTGDVVVVVGRGNLAEAPAATLAALSIVFEAAPNAKVLPALRRGNVVGALSVGLAPSDGEQDGLSTLRAAADGHIGLLVLLGADPLNDCPDADLARRAVAGARRVISIDTLPSESTKLADVVFPAAAYGEKGGTTTNLEGRVTSVAEKVNATGNSRPDWMIALELAALLGERGFAEDHPLAGVTTVAEVTAAMAATVDGWDDVSSASASALEGVVTAYPESSLDVDVVGAPDPISYDFRLVASRTLYDRAVGTQMSRSLAHLAPGAAAHVHPLDLDRMGVADGDDVNLIGPSASTVMPIKADHRVPRGVVWSPYNQKGGKIAEVIDFAADVIDLRIERI